MQLVDDNPDDILSLQIAIVGGIVQLRIPWIKHTEGKKNS